MTLTGGTIVPGIDFFQLRWSGMFTINSNDTKLINGLRIKTTDQNVIVIFFLGRTFKLCLS